MTEKTGKIKINVSSIKDWADCGLRAYLNMVVPREEEGYRVSQLVGDAVHAGYAAMIAERAISPTVNHVIHAVSKELDCRTEVLYDTITPDKSTAWSQVTKILHALGRMTSDWIIKGTMKSEVSVEMDLGSVVFRGRIDYIEKYENNRTLIELKTGRGIGAEYQLGSYYAMLYEAQRQNEGDTDVAFSPYDAATIWRLGRVGLAKPQTFDIVQIKNISEVMKLAMGKMKEINAFFEKEEYSAGFIAPNPASMMCSRCRFNNTTNCPITQKREEEDND